jgi:hypothetical protein
VDRGEQHAVAVVVEQGHRPGQVTTHVPEGVVADHRHVPQRLRRIRSQHLHLVAQRLEIRGDGGRPGTTAAGARTACNDRGERKRSQCQDQRGRGDNGGHVRTLTSGGLDSRP